MIEVKEQINIFKDKNILVVGLARSGVGAAKLLAQAGAHVAVTDKRPENLLKEYILQLPPSVDVVTGDNPADLFEGADMIVISPGVPLTIPPLVRARGRGVPVIGELELASQFILSHRCKGGQRSAPTPPFIGVTGTNGKSTTTTLIDLMLKESGKRTLLGGNIGNALTEEIFKTIPDQRSPINENGFIDYIVAEISSFQLETIRDFRPGVALILNISPDHLDRYDGMESYIDAKARIFENQEDDDVLILNGDDPLLRDLYESKLKSGAVKAPEVLFFSTAKEVKGVYARNGVIYCNLPGKTAITPHTPIISVSEIRIPGAHNLENAMAAALAALVSGCSVDAVRQVLRDFPGLSHRMEVVAEKGGVVFINDSKGTNPGAVAKSLESFDDVVLIMGGMAKNSDFSVLKDLVKQKVKLLVLLGEAGDEIASVLGGLVESSAVRSLDEAVELSVERAGEGDTVLLSPGCASFDMFKDFEDRGNRFREAVRKRLK